MAKREYIFHTDTGHGWLAVKRTELVRLGILAKVSQCSYQRGDTVYLEEDCDASLFIETKSDNGENIEFRESFKNNSPIRSYEPFSLLGHEVT